MAQIQHIPVLLSEVIYHLQPEPKKLFVDGTVGQGGHAEAIASAILPGGRLLAIDRDAINLGIAKKRLVRFGKAIVYVHDSFANVKNIASKHRFIPVQGIILDLGFSSMHIEDASRGFSFLKVGPLDMRYDSKSGITAAEIVNEWDGENLARIFRVYGEETKAQEIARVIVKSRRKKSIATTTELAELIATVVYRHGKTHPATKTFQALRIAVNDELGELERALPQCADILGIGGRLAIITFHSLEDRIVKQFFKNHPNIKVVTKKPILPTREEIKNNPRARSAKLRVAIKQ